MKRLLSLCVILFPLLTLACGGANGLSEGSAQNHSGSVWGGGNSNGPGGGNLSPGLELESPDMGPDPALANFQAFGIWREDNVATESYILRVRDIPELVAIYESFLPRLETTTTMDEVERLELELRAAVTRFFSAVDRNGSIVAQQSPGWGVNDCTYDLDWVLREYNFAIDRHEPFDPQSRRAFQFRCWSNTGEAQQTELPPS